MELRVDLGAGGGLLHRALAEFAEAGRALSLAELRELLRLDALMATDGGSAPARVLADQPVQVGNTVLYMPSLGALALLREKQGEWFGGDPATGALLVAWCCHHAREPAAYWGLTDEAAARRALGAWARTLSCTAEELYHATEAALAGFPLCTTTGPETGAETLALVANCLETYGGRLADWLWAEPAQRVLWLGRDAGNLRAATRSQRPGFLHAARAFQRWREWLRRPQGGLRP